MGSWEGSWRATPPKQRPGRGDLTWPLSEEQSHTLAGPCALKWSLGALASQGLGDTGAGTLLGALLPLALVRAGLAYTVLQEPCLF